MRRNLLTILLLVLAATSAARAERIKDIVTIKGVRDNPLWGIGLVTGLDGTGDDSAVSRRALVNMLRRAGRILQPNDVSSKNIASVSVKAKLGAFNRRGSKIDVTVSTIGSCKSLLGGTLEMTPLRGADGQVYAVAQGPLSVGGFKVSGQSSTIVENIPTVGRIPSGADVEREELSTDDIVTNGKVALLLRNPDFSTASDMATVINRAFPKSAHASDAGTVTIEVPEEVTKKGLTTFIDQVGQLSVSVDSPAVVVINARTGTIIVGEKVGISTAAIAHGNLTVTTKETERVVTPPPFAEAGTTETENNTELNVRKERPPLQVVPKPASVSDLARALNAMGLTPRDLISIFEALRDAGALQAELKIM